ncbi:MAG: glutathione synthase [Verrucomicrobia bacterium]|nr:glutathione synthase [Verrucomicrobiota bacterium]
MKMLFLMDPLESVDFYKDTTFAFMQGAEARGHEVYFLPADGISLDGNRVRFRAQPVTPREDPDHLFDVQPFETLTDDAVGAVFIRCNPPFDAQYLMNTWLLEPLVDRVAILNDPRGIRGANEKLWAMQFPQLMPPTLVTSSRGEFDAFLAREKAIVAKPTDGFGGLGVFQVRQGEANASVIFETLSDKGRRHIVLQGLVPEAANGDKRILLLNGEILGAVLRVQAGADHRHNFFAGGKPQPTAITEHDRNIAATLKPHLLAQGLTFVGIDVLGQSLIEVNVTSPTCLQEINRLRGERLELKVIEFAEGLATERGVS